VAEGEMKALLEIAKIENWFKLLASIGFEEDEKC